MLERVKGEINKGILSASINTSTYLAIEKIKGNLKKEKVATEGAFNQLGKLIYELWKTGNLNISELDMPCEEIHEKETNIQMYQSKITQLELERDSILGKSNSNVPLQKLCPVCRMQNVATGKFCIQCGTEFTTPLENEETVNEKKFCSCGAVCNIDAKFCTSCGKTFK
ncbi:zinc ribbon domain-containing protein [Enterocloster clostridioformis]|uniref:zinc ribbon domain-containing protein n=1 Tax=Enterocloster clostridioformis TaxID=1531 RepID=UPI001F433801|nr:zinc ribbon domain-containing protein [Enterocloster clostridioformis]MCF2705353.1 zinc ribbon domain-containing protein [Enterocloster clostridioformis]